MLARKQACDCYGQAHNQLAPNKAAAKPANPDGVSPNSMAVRRFLPRVVNALIFMGCFLFMSPIHVLSTHIYATGG
jgi:hypothetical protein